ncbi:hypothetical protein [Paenarthrobacter sp. AMU7]|uniref:DUF2613 family protein n=1 Tax=Paenarthrobacter sp. AMU7 TaxID=3162492 RepID=A0AB39YMP0_9MICC
MRTITGLVLGAAIGVILALGAYLSCVGTAQHTHVARADAQDFSLVD